MVLDDALGVPDLLAQTLLAVAANRPVELIILRVIPHPALIGIFGSRLERVLDGVDEATAGPQPTHDLAHEGGVIGDVVNRERATTRGAAPGLKERIGLENLAFLLASIHPSAWKVDSQKSVYRRPVQAGS